MSNFIFEMKEDLSVLCVDNWKRRKFDHGFLGVVLPYSRNSIETQGGPLLDALGVKQLYLLEQVHGVQSHEVTHLSELPTADRVIRLSKADAWILPRSEQKYQYGFAIETADCIPLIIFAPKNIILIHAGWRGLAAGIIETVCEKLRLSEENEPIEIAIGPAAGASSYVVGPEVIAAFQGELVFRNSSQEAGRYLLSLEDSAKLKIERVLPRKSLIYCSSMCTIQDQRFHSYRREGQGRGRNLCFVVL